jgi:hypothetical protein
MLISAAAEIRHATLKDVSKIMILYAKALPELKKLQKQVKYKEL